VASDGSGTPEWLGFRMGMAWFTTTRQGMTDELDRWLTRCAGGWDARQAPGGAARSQLRRSGRSASGAFDPAIQPETRPDIDKDQMSLLHQGRPSCQGVHGPAGDRAIAIRQNAD
jgi:hypothetical protein